MHAQIFIQYFIFIVFTKTLSKYTFSSCRLINVSIYKCCHIKVNVDTLYISMTMLKYDVSSTYS